MMTRKDYRATAEILSISKNAMTPEEYTFLVNKFAYMFKNDNPNFNRDKFQTACGVSE